MSESKPVIVVSADGHIGGRLDQYRPYLDPDYHDHLVTLQVELDQFLDITGGRRRITDLSEEIDPDRGYAQDGADGQWDPTIRLRELDREGVAAELLIPGPAGSILPFFSVMNSPYPVDVRVAGMQAFHRWAADFIAEGKGRWLGLADPGPCLDFDATRRELTWCKEHGFTGVALPQQVWDKDLPTLNDPYYEPFWQICDDLGLVLGAHAGWGMPQGKFQEFADSFVKHVVGMDTEKMGSTTMMDALNESKESPLALDMGPRRILWQLMLGGVFDRHPDLMVGLTEVRADWVPPTLDALDALYESTDTPLTKKPSEYFVSNCFVTPSSPHRCETDELRHQIGVDQFLVGTDYPHPEGTWPNTKDWIRLAF
ncbi:MAG: putative amidohydrolase, partial [Ilumatobacteraceae bacterium]|nr:putative amidohydrolase [Ilumatobacteraceae bacterium]